MGANLLRERVRVGPFNIDVFLLNAREFAVQFVVLLRLLNVKFWSKGSGIVNLAVNATEGLAIVYVEQPKDRSELLGEP